MPTRTQQCDILSAAYCSHGDTRHPILFPADPAECFELSVTAFDLAERLQTPIFVLSDLDIGMNDWMCPAFQWDDNYRWDRGKVLGGAELDQAEHFWRYFDSDGDGITYRTLPGVHPKGAYFTRGSGHNAQGRYTEDSDEYREVMDRLTRKFATAADLVPGPVLLDNGRSDVAILSIGSCDGAVREALEVLGNEGVALDYLRVRAFPFSSAVQAFLDRHDRVFVVEQNRDAQLRALLVNETRTDPEKLVSVLHYDGLPIGSDCIVDALREALAKGAAA
jgi:2-oxoglutarate ferredoxin oxidoreductase subunit alpha